MNPEKPDIYAENPIVDAAYIAAVMTAIVAGKSAQHRKNDGSGQWKDHSFRILPETQGWPWGEYTWRIHPDEKPKVPKIKVPLLNISASVVWIRNSNFPSKHYLVYSISHAGIVILSGEYKWMQLMEASMEWSPDRGNWHPCYIEVDDPNFKA